MTYFPTGQDEIVTLPATDSAVAYARGLAAEVTRRWSLQELTEGTRHIVSELATNAVKATRVYNTAMGITEDGRIRVRFRWNVPSFLIEVWDISTLLPERRDPDGLEESGRGLGIVEALCTNWGAHYCDEGKVVWAEQKTELT